MRNPCFMRLLMLLWSSVFSSVIMAQQTVNVTVERSWGLLLGDEVNVQVDVSTLKDGIDLSSLPQQGKRYGTWLYLKDIDDTAQSLIFNYQVINVPTKNTLIATPKFNIKLLNEEWVVIQSVSLTIGPSLASIDEDGTGKLIAKTDFSPTLIDTTKTKKQLKLFTVITFLSGLVLALWHFGWKPKNRQPFAQALHDLSRLNWQRSVKPDQASRILHTAFNRTAGTIVVYGDLDQLLERHSWLMPLKDDIDTFYQHSAEHFFTRQAGQGPSVNEVKKLAKACRSREKMA
ncbi:MAG: hypothetical protein OEW63_00555 [Gammaproteobacteria bacterium]|nr:hypothetical protein [Gammaproteobacteria bacterium]